MAPLPTLYEQTAVFQRILLPSVIQTHFIWLGSFSRHNMLSSNTSHIQLSTSYQRCTIFFSLLFLKVGRDRVHLLSWPLFGLLHQPQMIDDECGAVSGMRIGRRNQSIWRKSAPVPFRPQVPHEITWERTQAAAVGSWHLNASAMVRSLVVTFI
jgi:hypothetical protein